MAYRRYRSNNYYFNRLLNVLTYTHIAPSSAPSTTGLPGITGSGGDNGLRGITGSPGIPGSDGVMGSMGVTGSPGITGSGGIIGFNGVIGSPGITGNPGSQGSGGITGTQGPSNSSGTLNTFSGNITITGTTGQVNVNNSSNVITLSAPGSSSFSLNTFTGNVTITGSSGGIAVNNSSNKIILSSSSSASTLALSVTGTAGDLAYINSSSQLAKVLDVGKGFEWAVLHGSPGSTNAIHSTIADSNSNVYVIFSVNATFNAAYFLDKESAIQNTSFTLGNPSTTLGCVIGKLNSDGIWQWTARVGFTGAGVATTTKTIFDSNNDLYLLMNTSGGAGTLKFYNQGNTNDASPDFTITATGIASSYLAKISSAGAWQTINLLDGTLTGGNNRLVTDGTDVYACNLFTSATVLLKNTAGTTQFTANQLSSQATILVAKMTSAGSWSWYARVGSSVSAMILINAAIDSSANIYLAHPAGITTAATITYIDSAGTTNFTRTTAIGTTGGNLFIPQINSSGVWQWVFRADSGSTQGCVFSVVTATPPSVSIFPHSSTISLGFNYGGSNTAAIPRLYNGSNSVNASPDRSFPANNQSTGFLVNLDSTGTIQTASRYCVTAGTAALSTAGPIVSDTSGNIYILSSNSFNGVYFFNEGNITNNTSYDLIFNGIYTVNIFIAKCNSAGIWQGIARVASGSSGNPSLFIDSTDTLFATITPGSSFAITSFYDSGNNDSNNPNFQLARNIAPTSSVSIILASLSSNCTWNYILPIGTSSSFSSSNLGICMDTAGNIYMQGSQDRNTFFYTSTYFESLPLRKLYGAFGLGLVKFNPTQIPSSVLLPNFNVNEKQLTVLTSSGVPSDIVSYAMPGNIVSVNAVLVPGTTYYLISDGNGNMSLSSTDKSNIVVGIAVTSSTLLFSPRNIRMPAIL